MLDFPDTWEPYSPELYKKFCSKRGVWAVWWWSSTEEWIYSQAIKICPQIPNTQLPNITTKDDCWILNSGLTPF